MLGLSPESEHAPLREALNNQAVVRQTVVWFVAISFHIIGMFHISVGAGCSFMFISGEMSTPTGKPVGLCSICGHWPGVSRVIPGIFCRVAARAETETGLMLRGPTQPHRIIPSRLAEPPVNACENVTLIS